MHQADVDWITKAKFLDPSFTQVEQAKACSAAKITPSEHAKYFTDRTGPATHLRPAAYKFGEVWHNV